MPNRTRPCARAELTPPHSNPLLPVGVVVLERGWLSANGIIISGAGGTALVDTGYATHAQQTVALVQTALRGHALDLILNTHLHSDHCGGNAALQEAFPDAAILIPPGLADEVRDWDTDALTYAPTGQQCPRFEFDGLLQPGSTLMLGDSQWKVHAAPGHDAHSVVLFEPSTRTLIAADALWEDGFGVVFGELEGVEAFQEVAATLDLIEALAPAIVIPGHGQVFTDVESALARARSRLRAFVIDPKRHARHAAKVLLKFKLLELQRASPTDLIDWAIKTPYFLLVHRRFFSATALAEWVDEVLADLIRSRAARAEGTFLVNG
jgi:glyoxylase-like metal-dependent hydrolase (beta-lactamase superfamily II)